MTVIFASAAVVPPPPLQVSLKVLAPFVRLLRVSLLPVGFFDPENGAPLAVQVCASVTSHEISTLSPGATTSSDKVSSTTGAGTTSTVTVCSTSPLSPTHFSV